LGQYIKYLPIIAPNCELMNISQLPKFHSLALLTLIFLSACKTPAYTKVAELGKADAIKPEVQYFIADKFDAQNLNCVAVGKVRKNHKSDDFVGLDQRLLVRRSLFGVLSAKNYEDIELSRVDYVLSKSGGTTTAEILKKLDCDAMLSAEILGFENKYYVAYSITSVELKTELTDKDGDILWSARHRASSHEGAIPLSPFSMISGTFIAATNRQDEVAFQMIDAASRRILKTLPDRKEIDLANEIISELPKVDGLKVSSESNEAANSNLSAETLLAKGAYEDALLEANANIATNSDDAHAYYVAARASLMSGKYDDAIDLSLNAIAKGIKTAEAYSSLGIAYLKTDNLRFASAAIEKATQLEPKSAYLKFNLGVVREADQKLSAAAEAYFDAGNISLEQNDLDRLYRSFSSLKKLGAQNNDAQKRYLQLAASINKRAGN
jgi:tetratricopeptide (TPR) repeat protein